jgi:hypothetical protein
MNKRASASCQLDWMISGVPRKAWYHEPACSMPPRKMYQSTGIWFARRSVWRAPTNAPAKRQSTRQSNSPGRPIILRPLTSWGANQAPAKIAGDDAPLASLKDLVAVGTERGIKDGCLRLVISLSGP